MALTFTKYLPEEGRYVFNEMDTIIGEDYIITTMGLESERLSMVFDEISKEAKTIDGSYILDRQKNQ